MQRQTRILLIATGWLAVLSVLQPLLAQTLPVRVNRWLELRQTSGSVTLSREAVPNQREQAYGYRQ
ncbi:MAG: hypothetical protein HC873_16110 [Leptolyngbyaceae cyanobacterium SL_1_1]|nr:hypothetical protein [Leptolyngbyaceae cyanobacterium SL_1_1]